MSDDRIPDISEQPETGRSRSLMLNLSGFVNGFLRKIGFIAVAIIAFGGGLALTLQNIPSMVSSSDKDVVSSDSDENYQDGAQSGLEESDISDFIQQQNEAKALKERDAKLLTEQKANETQRQQDQTRVQVEPVKPVVVSVPESNEPPPPTPEEAALARKLSGSPSFTQKGASIPDVDTTKVNTSLDTPDYADGSASVSKVGYQDFLLKHGSVIPCALYTQVISEQSGFVTCRVTQDVYSANGAALLVERGSLVSGSQNVALEGGQARVFTAWSTIDTPLGVSIKIDSLGTGALGAAGIDAYVDNHFSERFGGAILLSFVDDALATASNRLSQSDSEVTFDNSSSNASDMASKALDSSINMAPTGYAKIGQRINILVVRNIDMSSVYQFE
ncbi:hypothetical protein O4N82_21845 [Vibrio parahaemolyticus]|uniref:TrbI/VirB10 family protein n=1 Tax=Vibrio parahaemolyticus TaxID=670 RepID=UPI0022B2B199|nr:TrbI/VirB10 family protein [Vibrio parahaemolyticus]EGU0149974.1 TrbI/VirB10 family protein [Vibrio parahaemolyticus]MCZ6381998.1 hypothetical protein [Vibrio parahaemolyticus]MCZ6404361.1 hypothetical protein [Vibrio parahaemolyticus]